MSIFDIKNIPLLKEDEKKYNTLEKDMFYTECTSITKVYINNAIISQK